MHIRNRQQQEHPRRRSSWQYKIKRDFNFTHHPGKTWDSGFGMTCSQKYVRGLKVHSIMASTTQGIPLGILEQQIWTRKPKSKKKKQKNQKTSSSILNKESKRWLTGLVTTELAMPSTTTVVTVTDREGHIYELFALEREAFLRVINSS